MPEYSELCAVFICPIWANCLPVKVSHESAHIPGEKAENKIIFRCQNSTVTPQPHSAHTSYIYALNFMFNTHVH